MFQGAGYRVLSSGSGVAGVWFRRSGEVADRYIHDGLEEGRFPCGSAIAS